MEKVPPHDEHSNEGFARVTWVTRRVLKQKEVTISMVDGKFAKNEIVIHYTGLEPNFDIAQAVKEASSSLEVMQDMNPIEPAPSKESKALESKTRKQLEA